MTLVDVVLEVHDLLREHRVAHAFGGALALAYITDPRGTVDIDLNVFTAPGDEVVDVFESIGFVPDRPRDEWLPTAGVRFRRARDPFPLDVFPPLDENRYAEVRRRVIRRAFGPGGRRLPFLGAEDLTVFKLSFGRNKDWVDLRNIAAARPDLDLAYVAEQLVALRGPTMYPRVARLRSYLHGPSS